MGKDDAATNIEWRKVSGAGRQIFGIPGFVSRHVEYDLKADVPQLLASESFRQFSDDQWESMQDANFALFAAAPALAEALRSTTQQLVDLHAAIDDQGIAGRFVDDSINMISEGQTSIDKARAALKAAGAE